MDNNYLPLFRKYRPQAFKDIVGQENLVKALTNAIELNRIANAYLFCGPRGTGKTSSARIFAKSLNCQNGPTTNPCQKCPSCVDITNATGLDVIEIDAASNRGIQDAKELISKVQYAPINGKYKIFIIDEVHMLSNDAFNALLKTFEEPPKNVIFILCTTEPHKVLETIVSRCQRFDLRRITTQDIIKRLEEISSLEGIKITSDALFTIAKNVSGGLRDSLALLDQVSVLGVKEEITSSLINELLGKINFDVLLNLLKNIYNSDIEKSIQDIDEIYSKGNEPRNLAENLIEFLRNVIVVLSSNNSSIEDILQFTTLIKEDIEKIKNSKLDKDKIIKILNIFVEYYKEIKNSTNPYLWVELASISACKLDLKQNNIQTNVNSNKTVPISPIKPVSSIQAKPVENKENKEPVEKPIETQNKKLEPINNSAPETVSKPQIQADTTKLDGAEIWMNITDKIPSLPARAFYTGVAKLVKAENSTITLGFLHENTLVQARSEAKVSQLNAAIKEVYPDYRVEFIKISPNDKVIEIKHSKPKPPEIKPSFSDDNQAKETFKKNDELKQITDTTDADDNQTQSAKKEIKHYSQEVQSMIEQFNGKIIEED